MLIDYANMQSLHSNQALSGENGTHRERQRKKIIKANTDLQAIHEWLHNLYAHKPNTFRAYQIDSERLLLWALKVKEKPISSLNSEDYQEYFTFLDNPDPAEQWCMSSKQKKIKRYSHNWRPFTGPLSPASKAKAVAAINKMLKYWFEQGYLDHHPLSAINLQPYKHNNMAIRKIAVQRRAFSKQEWLLILQALHAMPDGVFSDRKNKARLRFIVMTLIYTGLRRDELAKLTWNAYQRTDTAYYLVVSGKSGKAHAITLPDSYIDEIKKYRLTYQLGTAWPETNDYSSVIIGRYRLQAISANRINSLIKDLLNKAAGMSNDRKIQAHLKAGSAHWFRHTAATFLDEQAVDPMIIKSHMRHSNFSTTQIYIHKDEKTTRSEINKLSKVVDLDM